MAVKVPAKGGSIDITDDEGPFKANFEKMPSLKPAFEKDGTITAANASKINDGAAALVVASEEWAKANGWKQVDAEHIKGRALCLEFKGRIVGRAALQKAEAL
jgi:acetyl-CoA acetyltransferase